VLLDGHATRACTTPASEVSGRTVTTIEGLVSGDELHPVQKAFVDLGAMQCGYCTTGIIMAAVALLEENPAPTPEQIRVSLHGNVCRCCAYGRIEAAVGKAAAAASQGQAQTPSSGPDEERIGVPRAKDFWWFRPVDPWNCTDALAREYFELLGDGLVVVLGQDPRRAARGRPGLTREVDAAWLHVGRDGGTTAFTGKMNMGQDNRTALSLLVAEELRLPPSSVALVMGDTDLCPFDVGTFGSRSLPDAGEALRGRGLRAGAPDRARRGPPRRDVGRGRGPRGQGALRGDVDRLWRARQRAPADRARLLECAADGRR
jgi:[2Fe-2S] binding domain/Molybdopterin cofactor-binding domain